MQKIYTLGEAKELGDEAVFSIEHDKVLVTIEGNRFIEVESNVWAKVSGDSSALAVLANQQNTAIDAVSCDNIRYMSASHHSGGVVVRPLYVYLDDQWVNISTGKRAVFDKLA